jgi:DNA-binding CsgD family transcriptional regulator
VAQQGAVEAVLEPTGKLQDAAGAAKADAARQLLKEAVRGVERVRGGRRVDEDEVLSNWAPLLRTRWTLVDHFESDGRRYILARENTPIARGPKSLTARERQVVGYAALGHSSKLIAYELGIAYSTVRVLLSRAAAKLGAASREDLVRALRDAATR